MSCQPQELLRGEVVSALNIERVLNSDASSEPTVLASALALIAGGSSSLRVQMPGAEVSGSTGAGFLILTMNQANCNDGGMYTCTVKIQSSAGVPGKSTSSANLTVEGKRLWVVL